MRFQTLIHEGLVKRYKVKDGNFKINCQEWRYSKNITYHNVSFSVRSDIRVVKVVPPSIVLVLGISSI